MLQKMGSLKDKIADKAEAEAVLEKKVKTKKVVVLGKSKGKKGKK